MKRASHDLTLKQMDELVYGLDRREKALGFLRRKRSTRTIQDPQTLVWKTVKLGVHKTPNEYREALRAARCKIGGWGDLMLGKVSCLQQETLVDLVVVPLEQFGFGREVPYKDVCIRCEEVGLELCPAEVGPALRLEHDTQPAGMSLFIATGAPTPGSDINLFNLENIHGEMWLNGWNRKPSYVWDPWDRFVFALRKPAYPS